MAYANIRENMPCFGMVTERAFWKNLKHWNIYKLIQYCVVDFFRKTRSAMVPRFGFSTDKGEKQVSFMLKIANKRALADLVFSV